jgi:hypothetical protein
MKNCLLSLFTLSLLFPTVVLAQNDRSERYEAEAGILGTRNMDIHGYHQGNATEDWKGTAPTARFEYWSVRKRAWNFGVVAQPLYVRYSDTVKNDLNYNSKIYNKGDSGTLDYQFHSVRGTANYSVLGCEEENTYLRVGGSLIARYADLNFKTDSGSFHDTNFIAFPLINVESEVALYRNYSFLLEVISCQRLMETYF